MTQRLRRVAKRIQLLTRPLRVHSNKRLRTMARKRTMAMRIKKGRLSLLRRVLFNPRNRYRHLIITGLEKMSE